jgi:hypothetical protein
MGPPTKSTSTGHLQARRAGWPRTRSHPRCHRKCHHHREELPMLHQADRHLRLGPPPRHIAASSRSMCHSSMASSQQPLSRPTMMQRGNLGRRTQNTSSTALPPSPAWPRRPCRAAMHAQMTVAPPRPWRSSTAHPRPQERRRCVRSHRLLVPNSRPPPSEQRVPPPPQQGPAAAAAEKGRRGEAVSGG